MMGKSVRDDINKAMITEGRRNSENVDDNRHIEYWPGYGGIDTRSYTGHKMTQRERIEAGAVAALDQAGFGYGDKILARVKGGNDPKRVAAEEDRLDVEQNELRDQYPLANIGARALGFIGPYMAGKAVVKRVVPRILKNDSWLSGYYGTRAVGSAAVAAGIGAGYSYQKNKPRSGKPYDPRNDSRRARK